MKAFFLTTALLLGASLGPGEYAAADEGVVSKKKNRAPEDSAPKVGEVAPTFTLVSLDGKSETALTSFRGERPVVLFFGSYT